jgi:CHAT domain-containing protein
MKARTLVQSMRSQFMATPGTHDSLSVRAQHERTKLQTMEESLYGHPTTGQLDSIAAAYTKLRCEYDSMLARIRSQLPNTSIGNDFKPVDLQTFQRTALKTDEAFLSYRLGSRQTILFVVTQRDFRVFRLAPESELSPIIRLMLSLCQSQDIMLPPDSLENVARHLYQLLLEPAAPFIKGKSLLISPDAELCSLPFDALISSHGHMENGVPNYVVLEHAVTILPSATVLYELRTQPSRRKTVPFFHVIGAPHIQTPQLQDVGFFEMPGGDFALPYAEREIATITTSMPVAQVSVDTGNTATPDAVVRAIRSPGGGYLHIASHALCVEDNPMFSGFVLTPDGADDDGYLSLKRLTSEVQESSQLRLAVLSACQTGSGHTVRGEGTIGFARGLLSMGVSSVVSTLWTVNDMSTCDLMSEFYRQMTADTNVTQSLRKAKISLLHSDRPAFRMPRHWAAFAVYGLPD